MRDGVMWQGILTEAYVDTESKPGSTLLILLHKVGVAHPDPNTAWEDAEELVEKHQKRKNSIVEISVCPLGHHQEQIEGSVTTQTLN